MKNSLTIFVISISLMGILLAPACKKKNNDPQPLPDSTLVQKVDKILQDQIALHGVAGATLFVRDTKGNEAWTSGGLANIKKDISMNRETKMRIASVSKTFLAVVVLQLMEEGTFTLNDKFSDYLPDSVAALFPYGTEVTIFQLLGHTSGLYDFEDEQFVGMLLEDPSYHWTPWELLVHASTADSAVFFPPSTEYHYSNTNYIILGLLVEKVTGISMQQNIRSRILTPLNLSNTFSGGLEVVPQDNYAVGYFPLPDGAMMLITDQSLPLYFEWGHGQMISTVHDLWLFFNALSKKELFQQQSTLDAMLTWSPLSGGSYGLGISKFSQQLGYGHDGDTAGFYTFAAINPVTGTAIILCFNQYSETFMGAVVGAVYQIIS
ncbi:MAG: beta-lactamase family protein [Bacteroidales bacterium]|nr:beta-lactamase family protein [Bacteroidales bacterium]